MAADKATSPDVAKAYVNDYSLSKNTQTLGHVTSSFNKDNGDCGSEPLNGASNGNINGYSLSKSGVALGKSGGPEANINPYSTSKCPDRL